MENKKDIGKAFRDKLDQLDKVPGDHLWAAIHADLQKKKKRRFLFIPFWIRTVGIISLGILFSLYIFNGPMKNRFRAKPGIENTNPTTTQSNHERNLKTKPHRNISNPQRAEDHFDSDSKNTRSDSDLKDLNNPGISTDTKPAPTNIGARNTVYKTKNKKLKSIGKSKNDGVSDSENDEIPFGKNTNQKSKLLVEKHNILKGKRAAKSHSKKKILNNDAITNVTTVAIQKPIEVTAPETKRDADANNPATATAKEESKLTVTDSLKKKPKVPLKDLSREEKDSTKTVETTKINLFVYGAPTYSGTFSKISAIDKRLANNPKSSQISWSYGAYAMYEATPKWSLRFGVSKTMLKMVTRDAAIDTADYSNIGYKNFSNATIYSQSGHAQKMDIIQEISYTEIPLELKYALSNKKIGINIYGGISYMFLDRNVVKALTSNGQTFEIGETKNLNGNTFSGNLGIGLDYKFSRRLRFNLEPVMKYHLMDYKNVGRINPYTISILTGLQFSLHK
jgi:hypothetical protein